MSKTKTLFYFGYGSNMSTQYLIKRRKIIPLESQVACLKDYELIMNMGGPNFLEPSFANIRPSKGSTVEGVIHKINDNDLFAWIMGKLPIPDNADRDLITAIKNFRDQI